MSALSMPRRRWCLSHQTPVLCQPWNLFQTSLCLSLFGVWRVCGRFTVVYRVAVCESRIFPSLVLVGTKTRKKMKRMRLADHFYVYRVLPHGARCECRSPRPLHMRIRSNTQRCAAAMMSPSMHLNMSCSGYATSAETKTERV